MMSSSQPVLKFASPTAVPNYVPQSQQPGLILFAIGLIGLGRHGGRVAQLLRPWRGRPPAAPLGHRTFQVADRRVRRHRQQVTFVSSLQLLAKPRTTAEFIVAGDVSNPLCGPNGAATVELLKVLLRMTADSHGVAAKVIATVDELDRIAADDEADVPALKGWRRELFGDKALALKHGQLALAVDKGRVVTVEKP